MDALAPGAHGKEEEDASRAAERRRMEYSGSMSRLANPHRLAG